VQFGPNALHCRVHIVSRRGRHGGQDIEVGQVQARRPANLADLRNDDVTDVTRRAGPQYDAVSDFGRESNHAATQRGQIDRNALARRKIDKPEL
jgi:hypothetical protein